MNGEPMPRQGVTKWTWPTSVYDQHVLFQWPIELSANDDKQTVLLTLAGIKTIGYVFSL